MTAIPRKLSVLLFSLMAVFTLLTPVHAEGEDFDEFLKSEWISMMEDDYVTLHYSVKDYRALGITKPEPSFGPVGYAHYEDLVKRDQASLDQLHRFDYASLTDTQQHDYLVYERDLEDAIARNSYPDFKEIFNPYSGMRSDHITTLTEFAIREKDDIEDYLTLAHDFTRYFDDALEFTRQQAEKGFFLLDAVLDIELEQIDGFTAKREDNPLIVLFEKNIDAFEGLSEEEREAYKQRNRDIVFNEIIPEHEKIKAELEALRGTRASQSPVYDYPGGPEYYTALAQYKTSTRLSAQEMLDYLTAGTKTCMDIIGKIITADPTKIIPPSVTGFDTPEAILRHLENNLQNFPEGPEVSYTPSYLDPSVTNPNVMAYYLVCPIDDIKENVIRINGSLAGDSTSTLYSTLTHEGFPGHLYQCTYYFNTDPNPLRHDITVMGYQEGWAQYVIRDLMLKSGLDDLSAAAVYLNTYTGYVMQAAVDVAVNGLGYDLDRLRAWSSDNGLSFSDDTLAGLYDAVQGMPAQILPYGFGQLKFLEYRERMIHSLGDAFDEVEFHRQLLENGPRPFELVEEDLARYCESKGTTFTKEYTLFASDPIETDPDSFTAKLFRYLPMILIAAVIVILVILFFVIRGIIRLFQKKKTRQKEETNEQVS